MMEDILAKLKEMNRKFDSLRSEMDKLKEDWRARSRSQLGNYHQSQLVC